MKRRPVNLPCRFPGAVGVALLLVSSLAVPVHAQQKKRPAPPAELVSEASPVPDLTALADFAEVELDGIVFVKIPAGTFRRGTTDAERAELEKQNLWNPLFAVEQPAAEIKITRPFLLAKHEVTQKQWVAVMGPGDRRRPGNPSAFKGDTLPVDSISWLQAQEFCQKLNQKSKAKYRLPTEAEWEYAARAGGSSLWGMGADKQPISPANLGEYAWMNANSQNKTHPVATKKPNAWGLYDMLGNVWEWCQDSYSPTAYAELQDGTTNPVYGNRYATERVMRGGCWFLDHRSQRVALRGGNLPFFKNAYVGFRVVREIP
ncbi:MAG: formylglycine-generating enzyme family protein [Armatimonadaceae bacterium]